MKAQCVGKINERVARAVGAPESNGNPIYLGASNVAHMMAKHPDAYAKYGEKIPSILSAPDYVGLNPADDSIEYVKEFVVDGEYVKVAVRISGGGTYYARSLYVLNNKRVKNYITKGTLKKP